MAFKIAYMQSGTQPAYELITFKSAVALKAGMLLKWENVTVGSDTAGMLNVCGASDKPAYLCVEDGVTTGSGEKHLVQPIVDTAVYETTATAPAALSMAGKVVTTSAGLQVTATPVTPAKVGAYGATVITDSAWITGDKVLVKFEDKPQLPTT